MSTREDLVLAARRQFLVGHLVGHVAALVAREAQVVRDVGDAELRSVPRTLAQYGQPSDW